MYGRVGSPGAMFVTSRDLSSPPIERKTGWGCILAHKPAPQHRTTPLPGLEAERTERIEREVVGKN